MSEDQNISKLNNHGFTIIETLVAIAIFSIMFTALTSAIWSATTNFRTATFADESAINGQDVVEMLSVINIDDVTSPVGSSTLITRGNQKIQYDVVDISGNFRTIAISVFHSDDAILNANELRMKSYYRRMIYQ